MKTKFYPYRFLIAAFLFFLGLLLFYGFSRIVRLGYPDAFDFAVTVRIQDAIDKTTHLRTSAFVGDILEGSLFLASPAVSVIIIFILTLLAVVRRRFSVFNWRGFLFPAGFFLLTLLEMYGKSVVEHPAPPFFLVKNPTAHFPAYHVIEEYSYPSGHAARSLYLAVVAVFAGIGLSGQSVKKLFRKPWFLSLCLLSLVFCLSVSLSVVYLGHHWSSDVVGGAFLALALIVPAGLIYFL